MSRGRIDVVSSMDSWSKGDRRNGAGRVLECGEGVERKDSMGHVTEHTGTSRQCVSEWVVSEEEK